MTFKIVASQGDRIVFDQRVEAASPREAREAMKRALRLDSLTGLVYAITEIPAVLIEQIVTAKMARVAVGNGRLDVVKLVREAAEAAVKQELASLKNRLTALEGRKGNAGEAITDEEGSKLPQRFDPTPARTGEFRPRGHRSSAGLPRCRCKSAKGRVDLSAQQSQSRAAPRGMRAGACASHKQTPDWNGEAGLAGRRFRLHRLRVGRMG
jgi:hypothetical protein